MSQNTPLLSRPARQEIVNTVRDLILAAPKETFSALSAGLCLGAGNLPEAKFASLLEYVGEQSGPPEIIKQGAAAVEFLRECRRVDILFRQKKGMVGETLETHHALAVAGDFPLATLVGFAVLRGAEAEAHGTADPAAADRAADDLSRPYEDAAAAAGLPLKTILRAAFARGADAQKANPFQP